MNWTKVTIHTKSEGTEAVTGSLMRIGINGFEIEDKEEFKEFLTEMKPSWDDVDQELMKMADISDTRIKIYLSDDADGKETLALVNSELARLKSEDSQSEYGSLELEVCTVNQDSWENNWKQYFKPFNVGEKLLVKPSWVDIEQDNNRKVLEIDPGSSFGTGQHYTTRLCLEQLEKIVDNGDRVLDLGCGSGILSIASILLGADSAFGVDIDQYAVQVAIENVQMNSITQPQFEACAGDITSDSNLRAMLSAKP